MSAQTKWPPIRVPRPTYEDIGKEAEARGISMGKACAALVHEALEARRRTGCGGSKASA